MTTYDLRREATKNPNFRSKSSNPLCIINLSPVPTLLHETPA